MQQRKRHLEERSRRRGLLEVRVLLLLSYQLKKRNPQPDTYGERSKKAERKKAAFTRQQNTTKTERNRCVYYYRFHDNARKRYLNGTKWKRTSKCFKTFSKRFRSRVNGENSENDWKLSAVMEIIPCWSIFRGKYPNLATTTHTNSN